MKPEDQIKALAELDGFETDDTEVWCRPNEGNGTLVSSLEYLTSYDAIIPLVQKQLNSRPELRDRFYMQWADGRYLFNATPSQLCEALLRATGKWTENPPTRSENRAG